MVLKVKRLTETAQVPQRASEQSAGMDVYADVLAPLCVMPGKRALVPTGLSLELTETGYAIFAFARSGLAVKHGITLANAVGDIDADYRGELKIAILNTADTPYSIMPGERIAQLVVMPVAFCDVLEAQELSSTERGSGGFGSSGKQ